MGMSWHHVKGLVAARHHGVSFQKTLTLGRQRLFTSVSDVAALLKRVGLERNFRGDSQPAFAEDVYRALGAQSVDSLDHADYEGATITHDLNRPVAAELHNRFDVVDDGGTMEHVFNYPVALANAMKMVAPGGALLLFTPANNFMGHGFYTFSPELYYAALTEQNGYRLERMIAYHTHPNSQWFEVRDPRAARGRVELIGDGQQVELFIHATKLRDTEIFATAPQQSDYETLWTSPVRHADVRMSAHVARKFWDRIRWGLRWRTYKWFPSRLAADVRRDNLRRLRMESQPDRFIPVDH